MPAPLAEAAADWRWVDSPDDAVRVDLEHDPDCPWWLGEPCDCTPKARLRVASKPPRRDPDGWSGR